VVKVDPMPAPAPANEPVTSVMAGYGAAGLRDDKSYRNGSMVLTGIGKGNPFAKQGYDSRGLNFDPKVSIPFPYLFGTNRSLISTISSEAYVNGELATPSMVGTYFPDGVNKATTHQTLVTAAILTCLDKAPPADAFRPAYMGVDKTIYETKDIQWQKLPALAPVPATPDWDKMANLYQRPWLDHVGDWTAFFVSPGQNGHTYGGVVSRMNVFASLMLMLDVPREKKEKLMIGFLQYGIDLHGLAANGRQWFSDGGIWMGRKWPILFASLMLDKPELRVFPPVDASKPVLYGMFKMDPGSEGPTPTTFFQEDLTTYYGKGGQALWRVNLHTYARPPYQEKPYAEWTADDKFQNHYYWTPAVWPGFALSALYLKQKANWNHDAYFDFVDSFMKPGQTKINSETGKPEIARKGTDTFILQMWDAYRAGAPEQPGGKDNLMWQWTEVPPAADGKVVHPTSGHWIQNPKVP
jgi:hypothetical protein